MAWTTNNQTGVTFNLVLLHGTTELENMWHVRNFNWTFTNLDPVVLYIVRVTPFACGIQGNSTEIKVRTGKYSIGLIRIKCLMYNFRHSLLQIQSLIILLIIDSGRLCCILKCQRDKICSHSKYCAFFRWTVASSWSPLDKRGVYRGLE